MENFVSNHCNNGGGVEISQDKDNSFLSNLNLNSVTSETANNTYDFDASEILHKLRIQNINNVIIGHLNINSIASKVDALKTIIQGNIDVLLISESKLNQSHPTAQVSIDGFNEPYRFDRANQNGGGGILIYVRSDIPSEIFPNILSQLI